MSLGTSFEKDAVLAARNSRSSWLFPALTCLLTVLVLLVTMELAARKLFSRSRTTLLDCLVLHDPATGVHGIPGCKVSEKWEETPVVDYRLNACGDRTDLPCGPKQPGTYRIAMVGSSIAAGLRVSQDSTFAALLPQELSALTGRKVELYNLAMRTETPRVVDMRFAATLAKKPDLVLWVINPYDVGHPDDVITDAVKPPAGARHPGRLGSLESASKKEYHTFRSEPASQFVLDTWNETRMSFMIRHFLYENQSLYVNAFLRQNDAAAGYLRTNLSPAWQEDLRHFNVYLSDVQARAHAAGVPLVIALVPARVHAGLLSMNAWPTGSDPFSFDRAFRPLVLSSGAGYIDTLPDYRNLPHAAQYYFAVETHPTEAGHRFIAKTLATGLTNGIVPELAATSKNSSSDRVGN